MITGDELITITINGKDSEGKEKRLSRMYRLSEADSYTGGIRNYHFLELEKILKDYTKHEQLD